MFFYPFLCLETFPNSVFQYLFFEREKIGLRKKSSGQEVAKNVMPFVKKCFHKLYVYSIQNEGTDHTKSINKKINKKKCKGADKSKKI